MNDMKIRTYEDLKKWADSQPYDLGLEVGDMVIRARIEKGFTQEKLAKKAKTSQPAIARLESSSRLPSLTFLKRVMDAMGMDLFIAFKPSPLPRQKRG
jgi:transcriptional regulator with XRE-family HTH domain